MSFGVIRCDRPQTLLRQMRDALLPDGGRVVIALVLPFCPFVEVGAKQARPTESLAITGRTVEENIASFIQNELLPLGLQLKVCFISPPLFLFHKLRVRLSPARHTSAKGTLLMTITFCMTTFLF